MEVYYSVHLDCPQSLQGSEDLTSSDGSPCNAQQELRHTAYIYFVKVHETTPTLLKLFSTTSRKIAFFKFWPASFQLYAFEAALFEF